jgi:short-subunit dehydrogenase
LGAYPASKFPLAAYAQQLRLELGPLGLHTLLVCPGPIRRDDAGSRYDSKAGDLPAAAREPGGGVKLKGIDPDWLARRILVACERRQAELIVPGRAKLLFAISQLWPALGDWIVTRMTKQ